MKKYCLVICILLGMLLSCQKLSNSGNLADMGSSFERHLKSEAKENDMQIKIEMLQPVSYVELADAEKMEKDDAYLGKMYLVSKSWYVGGSRVFNMNDTISVYFDKNKRFLRIQENKK